MEKAPSKTAKWHLKLRLLLIILLIGSVSLLSGCGKREVEELYFVLGMGVDLGDKDDTYVLTLQMADPKFSGGGVEEIGNLTVSVKADSLTVVQDKINETLEKQPFYGTVRVFVLGEELARKDINNTIDLFQRFNQFRRGSYLLVAKGKAQDVLTSTIRGKNLPALSILDVIEGQKYFSAFPVTRLGHYLTVLGRDGQRPVIPLVELLEQGQDRINYLTNKEDDKELIVHKGGVFRDGKLVDIISDEESRGYLWLENEVNNRIVHTVVDDGMEISCTLKDTKTKFKVEEIEGQTGIRFKIKATAMVREVWGQKEEMKPEEWQVFLKSCEPYVAQVIQRECEAAVAKSKKLRLDFLGIGRKIEIKKPKLWRQIRNNWEEQLVDFPVAYEINVDVEHAGVVRNSPSSTKDE